MGGNGCNPIIIFASIICNSFLLEGNNRKSRYQNLDWKQQELEVFPSTKYVERMKRFFINKEFMAKILVRMWEEKVKGRKYFYNLHPRKHWIITRVRIDVKNMWIASRFVRNGLRDQSSHYPRLIFLHPDRSFLCSFLPCFPHVMQSWSYS